MGRITHMLAPLTIAAVCARTVSGRAEDADVARGKYLVELGGCTHCGGRGGLRDRPAPRANFNVSKFRAQAVSDNPVYLTQRERLYEGLLLAGVPES